MPSRRPVLATAASLLAAGCLGPVRSRAGNGDTDECVSGVSVHADPFQPADQLPVRLSASQRRLVDRLVADGSAEIATYAGEPPVRDGVYLAVEGTYYRAAAAEVGTEDVPAQRLDIEWEAGQTPPDDAPAVPFADLPEADRRALRLAIRGPTYSRREKADHPTEGLSMRDAPMPYPNGTDGSRLIENAETWVRWNDRTYRVASGDATTATRYTYRCSVTAVADSADGFHEHVVDTYRIRLADLTDAERSVLERATADGYRECEPASEGLARLRERLPDDRRLPHPHDGSWLVRFDGGHYELDVTNWIE